MMFLPDGRLMVGCSKGVVLLEEVRVDTIERWTEARIVAVQRFPDPENYHTKTHFICLSPHDDILAFRVCQESNEVLVRRLLIE